VPKFDRYWIATVLTAQVGAGAALGIVAQVFLVWAISGHVLFGLKLLDMARGVANCDLPARVGQLFGSAYSSRRGHRLVPLILHRLSR